MPGMETPDGCGTFDAQRNPTALTHQTSNVIWGHMVGKGAKEETPPTPKGKCMEFTSFVNANSCHNFISGKSVTGIVQFANQTVIDTFPSCC